MPYKPCEVGSASRACPSSFELVAGRNKAPFFIKFALSAWLATGLLVRLSFVPRLGRVPETGLLLA